MKQVTLPLPEVAIIAATRAVGAAGAGLLFAEKLARPGRRRLGWVLLGIGLLTTVPLLLDIARRTTDCERD